MKKIIVFLVMFVAFIVRVEANSITLNCPTQAYVNENFTCTLSGNFSTKIAGINGSYTYNGLSYVSFNSSSGWNNFASTSTGFVLVNTNGSSGTFTFGTLTLKATAIGSKSITTSYEVSDIDYNLIPVSKVSKTINIVNRPQNNNSNNSSSNNKPPASSGSSSVSKPSGSTNTTPSKKPSSNTGNNSNNSTTKPSSSNNTTSNPPANSSENNNASAVEQNPTPEEPKTEDVDASKKVEAPLEEDDKEESEENQTSSDDNIACENALRKEQKKKLLFICISILLLILLILSNISRIKKIINNRKVKDNLNVSGNEELEKVSETKVDSNQNINGLENSMLKQNEQQGISINNNEVNVTSFEGTVDNNITLPNLKDENNDLK